jgi:hypothetical protein
LGHLNTTTKEDRMLQVSQTPSPERIAIMQWAARMGAITAEALADRQRTSVASARMRLIAAERSGLLLRRQPLAGRPALFTITRAGLGISGLRGVGLCSVSATNALHLMVCAEVAAALERGYPDHLVLGERELRRAERERGAPIASACMPSAAGAPPQLHRPDLILWPKRADGARPVAVEVELTTKAPRRLAEICRAWARCRHVAGVVYLAPPPVQRALGRAIHKAAAGGRIVVVPLDAVPHDGGPERVPTARTVQGDA